MIQFTLSEAWAIILSICGGIVTISAAVAVALKVVNHFRKPGLKQDEEIALLWREVNEMKATSMKRHDEYMTYFANDKTKLDEFEKSNRVTQQALLALLSHGIDGNDVESLKEAKHNLEQHLIMK